MPHPYRLVVRDDQRAALLQARAHHPKPSMREQTAAIALLASVLLVQNIHGAATMLGAIVGVVLLTIDRRRMLVK